MTQSPQATPDTFVGIAPVNWDIGNTELLTETHGQHWLEEATYTLEMAGDTSEVTARGGVEWADGPQATLVVEKPLDELHTLAGTSKEPYTPTEVVLLKDHHATWRFMVKGGARRGGDAARRFARVASTLVEAGAAGIFMPGLAMLHSPRFVKLVTMDLQQPQNLTNLCVHAWNEDDWMMTRGLTAFGLPELETPIDEGKNAAYFRLMDIAAGMITENDAYPDDSQLSVGPNTYTISDGQCGPADEEVAFSGTFGVQTIRAK